MIIFYIIIILFVSCASQGTPSGGPIDTSPPKIIDYQLKKSRFGNQIIVEFDEVINPKSVVSAIKVNESVNFRYKVSYDKIVISDFDEQKGIVELYISRDLSDFQDNRLDKPINLFFSENQSFLENEISGQLTNINESLIYEIALFRIENESTSFIKKTQSDNKGYFIFQNLDYGEYRLYAVEGKFTEYKNDFRKLRYGIQSDELLINKNQTKLSIDIMIDEPLERKEIVRAKMIDENSAEIIFLDGSSKDIYIRDKVNNFNFVMGDTITIRLKQENRLERYSTKPFTFIASVNAETRLESLSDTTIIESDLLNEIAESLEDQINLKEGSLKGTVNYTGDYKVVVRLSSILDSLKYHTVVDSGVFEFNSVRAGKYTLDSYELKANNPENYHSGIWIPFEKSAKFTTYPDEIEIRSRWLIEDIEVNYN